MTIGALVVVGTFIGVVLYWVVYMMHAARVDKIISEIRPQQAKIEKEDQDIAVAQKELEDAQIRYDKSRAEYGSTPGGSGSSDPAGG